MKKLPLALVTVFLLASTASSYTVITDPNVFYSRYASPKQIIEFMQLKDGTSIENISNGSVPKTSLISDSNDNCIIPAGEKDGDDSPVSLTVNSDAFSDHWYFRGAHPATPGLFCEVIIWFDQGITSGKYNMVVSVAAGHSEPFAIYTSKGFIGVVPGSSKETNFIFDGFNKVFSFETGYSELVPKQELTWPPHKDRIILVGGRQKGFER